MKIFHTTADEKSVKTVQMKNLKFLSNEILKPNAFLITLASK